MRNDYQKEYFRRAKIVSYFLQLVPFIRMVGLNGSLARGEAKPTSDIDFFVAAQKGRIWLTRFLVSFIVELSGYRRQGQKVAGRICLNRYQTNDYLEILPHNEYHARVFSQLMPLIDINGTYNQYLKKNVWMKKMNWPVKENKIIISPNRFFSSFRNIGEKILGGSGGDWLENVLKKYQKQRILSDQRTITSSKGRIRVSDKELCFHPRKTPFFETNFVQLSKKRRARGRPTKGVDPTSNL